MIEAVVLVLTVWAGGVSRPGAMRRVVRAYEIDGAFAYRIVVAFVRVSPSRNGNTVAAPAGVSSTAGLQARPESAGVVLQEVLFAPL